MSWRTRLRMAWHIIRDGHYPIELDPEAIDRATLALAEVLLIPDPLNPKITLIRDAVEAALVAAYE